VDLISARKVGRTKIKIELQEAGWGEHGLD